MIRGIRKIASVKNLFTASCSGQIATLLTLSMVIVLMVIVATIKVGNLSTKGTTLSNAADSSALLLASQLSTKAFQLWDSLEGDPNDGRGATKKCKKSSFLSMLLGAIFAIIAVVVMIYFPPFAALGATYLGPMLKMAIFVAIAATSGAAGGAVGAVASGTNILQGMAQGAAIGAAIGGIAAGSIGMMNPGYFSTLTSYGAFGSWPTYATLSTSTLWGAIGTGVTNLGSTLYKAWSEANAIDKSFSEAARALNGLPEKDTYREAVFLNALSQTIEDQNTTKTMGICKAVIDGEKEECAEDDEYDPYDADNDGDKDEIISYFSYWWDRRIKDLKELFPKLQSRTQDFIKCDTKYQLYECGPENKQCKKDEDQDDKEDKCWQTPKPSKDGKVPLNDFRYFAQSQYSAAYECKYSTIPLWPTGTESPGYTSCSPYYGYYEEYPTGWYYAAWTPGPLYRAALSEWKEYLMCSLNTPQERNTCGYDSASSGEQCKQAKDTAEPAGDGVVVALAEALDAKGIGVSFYKSGLKTRVEKDKGDICDTCALEPYHDEVEAVTSELNSLADSVNDLNQLSAENLASTWESWIRWYYDEGSLTQDGCDQATEKNTDDYYDTLQVLIDGEDLDCNLTTGEKKVTLRDCAQEDHPAITDSEGNEIIVDELQGLKAWQRELKKQKDRYINKLPACELSYSWGSDTNGDGIPDYYNNADYYANYPCYDSAGKVVTIDGDQDDEFAAADTDLQALIDEIGDGEDPPKGSIRYEMKQYDTDMRNLYKSSVINFGGKNPITYRWRDSACPVSLTDTEDWDNDCDTAETGFCHSIEIQTSDFKAPWVKKKSSGGFLSKKVCLILMDYCYDPDKKHVACGNTRNPVWVQITKKDITAQDTGILGKFTRQDEGTGPCQNLTEQEKKAKDDEDKQVRDNKLERITIKKKAKAYFSYNKLGLEEWEESK